MRFKGGIMFRRVGLVLVVLGALAVVQAASGAFPAPFATQGGEGVYSNDGSLRFVAKGAGSSTVISAIKAADGSELRSQTFPGSFGVPMMTQKGPGGGMFRDGNTFVLQSTGFYDRTKFLLVGTQDLAARDSIALKGTFGFDALSPDGARLFLIQHMSANDIQHYVVRVYDLNAHKLLPGRIADKTQKGWVMQGWAVARTSSDTGRWVYTLYANPGGVPFVHALDTVKSRAHCIGIPWPATDRNQGPVFDYKLSLAGTKLLVQASDGSTYRAVNLSNWKVSKK
jgi:hypothetical protein